MMMMNCFCGMVDRRKSFSPISSRDHCQRSSPSRIFNTPRAGFEPAQNLNSGLVEWSYAVVKTTTPLRQEIGLFDLLEDLIYNWGFGWIFRMIYSYSEPTQTSKMKLSGVNYFRKMFHLRYLTGFWNVKSLFSSIS